MPSAVEIARISGFESVMPRLSCLRASQLSFILTKTNSLFSNQKICVILVTHYSFVSVINILSFAYQKLVTSINSVQNFIGDVVSLFAGMDCASDLGLVRYRLKKFVHACIRAVYGNRLTQDLTSYLLALLPHMNLLNFIWLLVTFVSVEHREGELFDLILRLKTKLF